MTQSELEGEFDLHVSGVVHHEGSQGWNREAGLDERALDSCYWPGPHGLLSLPSSRIQNYQPRDGTTHDRPPINH